MIDEKNLLETASDIRHESINSAANYSGSVEIRYIDKHSRKPKIIRKKNTGKSGLFTAISRFLAGEATENYIPHSIMGFYIDNSGSTKIEKEGFTAKIPFTSKPILFNNESLAGTDESNIVQYTFLIPYMNLCQNNYSITKLVLYNKKNIECAEIELDNEKEILTDVTSNILVYWRLKFDNTPTQQKSEALK